MRGPAVNEFPPASPSRRSLAMLSRRLLRAGGCRASVAVLGACGSTFECLHVCAHDLNATLLIALDEVRGDERDVIPPSPALKDGDPRSFRSRRRQVRASMDVAEIVPCDVRGVFHECGGDRKSSSAGRWTARRLGRRERSRRPGELDTWRAPPRQVPECGGLRGGGEGSDPVAREVSVVKTRDRIPQDGRSPASIDEA